MAEIQRSSFPWVKSGAAAKAAALKKPPQPSISSEKKTERGP